MAEEQQRHSPRSRRKEQLRRSQWKLQPRGMRRRGTPSAGRTDRGRSAERTRAGRPIRRIRRISSDPAPRWERTGAREARAATIGSEPQVVGKVWRCELEATLQHHPMAVPPFVPPRPSRSRLSAVAPASAEPRNPPRAGCPQHRADHPQSRGMVPGVPPPPPPVAVAAAAGTVRVEQRRVQLQPPFRLAVPHSWPTHGTHRGRSVALQMRAPSSAVGIGPQQQELRQADAQRQQSGAPPLPPPPVQGHRRRFP